MRNNVDVTGTDQGDVRAADSSPRETRRAHAESAANPEIQEFSGDGFILLCPRNVHITRLLQPVRATDNFESYSFTHQGEEVLSLYVGNWPGMLSFLLGIISESSSGTINGLPYKRVRVPYTDGMDRMEVLIKFTDGRAWPAYLHFRYKNAGSPVEKIAEKIIQSVKSQEAGSMPDPSLYGRDPAKHLRLFIQFAERSLEKLKEFRGATVNPFPDRPGDPKENLALAIREDQEQIEKLKAMLEDLEKKRDQAPN